MSVEQDNRAWRSAGLSVALLLLLILGLYKHTVLYLSGLWNQLDVGEYAHGYLVLAISVYLIFNNRRVLFNLAPRPEYRALPGVVAASMLWMTAALVDVEMIQALGLLLLILFIVWTVLGNQVIRVLAFPILFIGFAIPIWFPLSPILQNLTADVVFGVIRQLSIPALRQDNMIMLPAGTMSIEEACSGLRYLLASLTLGSLYAYMNYSGLRARLIVVLISACAAVLANILRVFIVVYLGYATEMQHPLVDDHLSLGWYLFGGLVVVLLIIDVRLSKHRPIAEPYVHDVQYKAVSADYRIAPSRLFLLVVGAGLLVSASPAAIYLINHNATGSTSTIMSELPQEVDGWMQVESANDSWMPVYHGAIDQKFLYKKNIDEVILYVGYYPIQKQGKELINDLNHINNKDRWHAVYPKSRLQNAENQDVLVQVLDNGSKKQLLVWYWYNVAGIVTTNRYEAKILQILGMLTGKPWAFVIAVAMEKNDNTEINRQILEDFILAIDPSLGKELE